MLLIYSIALAIYLVEAVSQQHKLLMRNIGHYLVLPIEGNVNNIFSILDNSSSSIIDLYLFKYCG